MSSAAATRTPRVLTPERRAGGGGSGVFLYDEPVAVELWRAARERAFGAMVWVDVLGL